MLLRVNSEITGTETNLQAINDGANTPSGVPQGELLSQLVELTLDTSTDNSGALAEIRQQLHDALGAEGLVDACAIIGNFQRMVRIADGTGIPLDKPVAIISAGIRKELNFDRFGSAERTAQVSPMMQWLGEKLRPLLIKMMAR